MYPSIASYVTSGLIVKVLLYENVMRIITISNEELATVMERELAEKIMQSLILRS